VSAVIPWYRQFWPWFLFGLPGIVVVAGLTTVWIAYHHADHLVVDDYYKQGLAINREIDRQQLAQQLQMEATLSFESQLVRASLTGNAAPPALLLTLSHTMDANQDFSLKLPQVQPGVYQAPLPRTLQYRWHYRLEPLGTPALAWRLDGEVSLNPRASQP
jgi:hypothetical protein